jgi:UDP-N-acetylmuramoyl-L-alanyl-D-glutamate--2,6-diaminopimelate ligase
MKLSPLLEGVPVAKMFQTMFGRMVVTHDVEIRAVQYDSRKVEQNDCFVAIKGGVVDGHQFIENAIGRGAKVVIMERETLPDAMFMHLGVVKIVVGDSRKALAQMSANFYDHPSRQLQLVGITGTNGKTTTTHIVKAILEAANKKTGLIGTIECIIGDERIPATHTTPESVELNQLFRRMVDARCSAAVMEVSSHALHQSRVHGTEFMVAVFTNLTQDHLDYHGTMEDYFRAKKTLFDGLKNSSTAIINADDEWGRRIVADSGARIITYAVNKPSDILARDIELSIHGTKMQVEIGNETTQLNSQLVGRFNVYNTLAAIGAGVALGIPLQTMKQGIEHMPPVRGRFERIASDKGWTAIVDYAHTPDALEKCLRTVREVLPQNSPGRVVTVFGAGGDRDKTKRLAMGAVVSEFSDVAVVTSDNPRTEDPDAIIDDILAGMSRRENLVREVDRRKAIQRAVEMAAVGDVIIVAGKGHEDYQVIGKEKIHFSDREEIEKLL